MSYINAQGANLSGCGIGAVAEGDNARIDAQGADFSGCGIALLATDTSFLNGLGFPVETDPKEIAQLLTYLSLLPKEIRPQAAKESSLLKGLTATVDVTTILANVTTAVSSPMFMNLVKQLGF